ncbi:MAG: glycosyltransferase family 9 protein [Nitrospinae bacterium]|nr:glycosyltransferase family 9 protein [Nitrospinota bacterium]
MTPNDIRLPDRPRILVARTDRIGDVTLSLPVFTSLKMAFPRSRICALTRSYTAPLLRQRPDVDEVIEYDSPTAHIPRGRFLPLLDRIKKEKFNVAIALYSNFSVGALIYLAGIPTRIGPATKLAQIFYNIRIRQRRSSSTRHEADHNLDLLKPLGVEPVRVPFVLPPASSPVTFARLEGKPLVGIHPGSGGSSRNWAPERYAQLARELFDAGMDVVITGAPREKTLVERVAAESGRPVTRYLNEGTLMDLAGVLAQFDVFVAGSTGPLHLASAAGTPVVGLYCPIFVCLPQRWGPIGPKDTALVPNVEPCERCVSEKCPHFDCMDKIDVELVKNTVLGKVAVMELPR